MSDPAERGQELGLPSCTALVVASMIGAGVFTTSGYTLADLRSRGAVLAAWALGGGLATCGALSYAALSRRFPVSGGEYEYLTRALHPVAGTLAGWVSLLAGFTVPLAVAAGAFDVYVGAIVERDTGRLCGSMAIVAAGVAHGLQVRVGALLQNTIVLAKVLLIGGLIGFGACVIAQRGAPPPLTGARDGAFLPAFATGLVWISFAYSGWNAAVYVASEVRTPERTVARSLLLGTFAVTAMYLGLNAVFLFAAPADRLAGRPEVAAVAVEALGGSWLRVAVSALVALALLTSIASLVMTGPRVYARMAEDGVLPRVFAFRRGRPPRAATLLQCALALAALWIGSLDELMSYVGWTLAVCSALTVVGLFRVRLREGALAVPVRGWPWVPAVYVLAVLAIAVVSFLRTPRESAWGLATLAVGVVVFALRRR